MYPDDGDILQQDQIRRDLLDRPRRKAYDDDPRLPPYAFQGRYHQALYINNLFSACILIPPRSSSGIDNKDGGRGTYHGIVDDIHPLTPRDLHHLFLPILCRIIDRVVRPSSLDTDLAFRFPGGRRYHFTSQGFQSPSQQRGVGQLHCSTRGETGEIELHLGSPFAICTAANPTPPAPAWTKTQSPFFTSPLPTNPS